MSGRQQGEDEEYARRRELWDAKQAAKMRRATKDAGRQHAREDAQRARDMSRPPPPGWVPEEGTRFGSNATEELREALE